MATVTNKNQRTTLQPIPSPTMPTSTSMTASTSSTTQPTTHEKRTPSPTKAGVPPAYRLLYRGALALPDSLMLLDGLTFGARLDSPVKHMPHPHPQSSSASASTSTSHLLENPLALALESMRGRPTLRMLGAVRMEEVYLDESGRVEM